MLLPWRWLCEGLEEGRAQAGEPGERMTGGCSRVARAQGPARLKARPVAPRLAWVMPVPQHLRRAWW